MISINTGVDGIFYPPLPLKSHKNKEMKYICWGCGIDGKRLLDDFKIIENFIEIELLTKLHGGIEQ